MPLITQIPVHHDAAGAVAALPQRVEARAARQHVAGRASTLQRTAGHSRGGAVLFRR